MERVLTQEERIRRAEEIYLRRRNLKPQYKENREYINSKQSYKGISIKLFKRMTLQIVICLMLYCIFYLIYDTNYSFSNTTLSTTEEILNYDINFNNIYKYISENVMGFINKNNENTQTNIEKDNLVNNNEEEKTQNNDETINIQDNISEGQSNENDIIASTISEKQNVSQEASQQLEQTSEQEPGLKQLYPLILPVKRRIYII